MSPALERRSTPDWTAIRARAAQLPENAFDFVREGLSYSVRAVHGEAASGDESRSRHITGQQLCHGLRKFALDRYGQLAGTVMRRWGLRGTEDFGVIVYALIDREEMRASDRDRFEDFIEVYDFEEAFAPAGVAG